MLVERAFLTRTVATTTWIEMPLAQLDTTAVSINQDGTPLNTCPTLSKAFNSPVQIVEVEVSCHFKCK